MTRPSPSSIAVSALGGIANATLALALIDLPGYQVVESTGGAAAMAVAAFCLGFVPLVVSLHTRLITPGLGLIALLAGVASLALTTPPAEKLYELGGHPVVSEPALFWRYWTLLPVWVALSLVGGLAEFAIRRGYGLGVRRLRNLPTVPLSRARLLWLVVGSGLLVGLGAANAVSDDFPGFAFVVAAAATIVPIGALLSRGLVAPTALFAIWVPRTFHVEAFGDPHGPLHLVMLGPFAVACAIVGLLEALYRSRYRGWDGGRFTGSGESRESEPRGAAGQSNSSS